MKEEKIKVLALLPMELPKEIELNNTLEAIGRFDQRQRISYLCPSNSLCRMEKSLQTAINPVSTFGMVFIRSNRSGFLYQGPVGILYLVL